jgi:CBS domain-containing protein
MRPVAPQLFVAPQTPLARAEALLNDNGAGALAVVNGEGRLVGLLLSGRVKRRTKSS